MTGQLWMLSRKHPPSIGGMQQLSLRLVLGLSARMPVTAITWGRGAWGLPLFLAWAQLRLALGIALGRVGLVHLGDPALAALGWLPRLAGVPVFATVHGLDITHPASWYQAYLARFFWGRMAAYPCISHHVQSLVLAHGVPLALAPVIVPGVELDRAGGDADPPGGTGRGDIGAGDHDAPVRLLCLGRLVERKGVAWFLDAVAPAWFARHPDVRLDIVGDGPLRARVESLAADPRLQGRVAVHGEVDAARKRMLLARADLVLVPNIPVPGDAEGFGLVCLEAGASGTWVLAADLEGLRDAIAEGVNGQRIASGDADAWCRALDGLCTDRDRLRALGAQARESVQRSFGWPAAVDAYERLVALLRHAR